MNNLEYLKSLEPIAYKANGFGEIEICEAEKMRKELRQLKALEIIAEELCILNDRENKKV